MMSKQTDLLLPTQELDIFKIMEELGLDPGRLFEYVTAIRFEEREYHAVPVEHML